MPKRRKKPEEPVLFHKLDDSEECVVHLVGGKQLCCPAYPAPCQYLRVLDHDGEELGYWSHTEFEEDACDVMGALMGLLNRTEDEE